MNFVANEEEGRVSLVFEIEQLLEKTFFHTDRVFFNSALRRDEEIIVVT